MDTDFNINFMRQDRVSGTIFNNNKKLRVGIMINNFQLETWAYTMVEAVARADYASLELVIINKNRTDTTSYLDKLVSGRKELLYIAYTRLENRIIQNRPDAFALKDIQKFLENVPEIEIQPKMDKYSDYVDEEDVKKIREFNLDVILWCGFRTLKGTILTAARYGVWSYHYDDNTVIRGLPPGFWETFERMGERGVLLQILTEDLDNGIVLYRSSFGCNYHLVKRNNNTCYLRSSLFVPRTLKKLYSQGEESFFNTIHKENEKYNFYNYPLYTPPPNGRFLKMLIQHVGRMGVQRVRYQFFQNQWILLYDLSDTISTSFWRFKKIIPPKDRFWADPHVFFRDDTYYIFIEEYLFKGKKGHISLIEMQPTGEYSDTVKVLEEPFHLSYPNIFENNGTLYMIPETQQAHSINLYECTGFPTEWKHKKTLIDSVDAVDSTILLYNNTWWLFTNIAEPEGTTDDFNELFLFYSDDLLNGDWHSHPLNPVISDVKRARSAGKILKQTDTLYRPSQCGKYGYGYGIKLNEIVTLTENDYLEKEIAFIEPNWDKKLKGVHTFCHENRVTMIDGFYQKFK